MTTAKARLASSKTARTQAQERLSLVNEGARTEEVALAKTHIAQSEAALREAKAQRTQLAVKREELAEAQALVRKQEEAKHLAEANRGKVTVSEEEIQALQASVEQATWQADASLSTSLSPMREGGYVRACSLGAVWRSSGMCA